jgi:hypothetical protein
MKVRRPAQEGGTLLDADASDGGRALVPLNTHWQRRLAAGDVVLCGVPTPVKVEAPVSIPAVKKKVLTAPAEEK